MMRVAEMARSFADELGAGNKVIWRGLGMNLKITNRNEAM
jgi:hypothetical protein